MPPACIYLAETGHPTTSTMWTAEARSNLCDTSGTNSLHGHAARHVSPRALVWFYQLRGADKLVCVAEDGRLLDGDIYASRPMLQLQPYYKADGTRAPGRCSAYEESKGMGHSLAA